MRLIRIIALLTLLTTSPSGICEEWQSLPDIQRAVEDFVKEKAAALPGTRDITVSRIDQRLKLARCEQLQPYLPAGNRLWGNSSIGVRCLAPSPWALYVPVHIRVSDRVLVAARPIGSGQSVQAEDVQLQTRDITRFAGSALTSLEQTRGKSVMVPVASGTVLRSEMLRAAKVIRQGQSVQVVAQGNGFRITSEGTAMGNATAGQVVSVKTQSGEVVKGIATEDGRVEVRY